MRRLALHLVMLFAAVMVGAWPVYAGLAQHPMPVKTQSALIQSALAQPALTTHHMDAQHGAHGGNGDVCDDHTAECFGGFGDMAVGHCASWVLACGSGIAGTLPANIEFPSQVDVPITHWQMPDDESVTLSASPDLRPPRHSS